MRRKAAGWRSSPRGGPTSIVSDGATGRLCPPDAVALADAVCELAAQPLQRERLARTALEAVRERTWERSLRRLADGYRRALRSGTGRPGAAKRRLSAVANARRRNYDDPVDTPAPPRPRHHPPVEGEIRRTEADLPDDARRRRWRTAGTAARIAGTRPQAPSLVGSAAGAIARLLLTIPSYAVIGGERNSYGVVFRDLIAKLPASTELVNLKHDAAAETVREWLLAAGRDAAAEVVGTDDFLGFSVWAEDAYVVIEDGERSAFVEPATFPRYADALVADQVGAAAGLALYQAPLHLRGGNVLIGDDFYFVGIDYPLLTFEEGILTAPTPAGEDELLREVYRRYLEAQRRFVPVGTTLPVPAAERREFRLQGSTWVEELYAGNVPGTRQPIFHIDVRQPRRPRPGRALPRARRRSARGGAADRRAAAAARDGGGLRRHRARPRPPRLRCRAHAAAARLPRRHRRARALRSAP